MCKDLPKEFAELFDYAKGLDPDDVPNYDGIKKKFEMLYRRHFEKVDNVFDWDYLQNPVLNLN